MTSNNNLQDLAAIRELLETIAKFKLANGEFGYATSSSIEAIMKNAVRITDRIANPVVESTS